MAKRSIGTYYSGYFKMPSVNRQDLLDIEKIVLSDLHPERYHVVCQGFVYDRVEDIPTDAGTAVTLVVYTHAPCLRLKFARSWAELYCEDNNAERDPVIRRLGDIVTRRERRTLWKFSRFAIWAAPMLGFGVVCEVVMLILAGHLSRSMVKPGVAFLVMMTLWWIIAYRATLFRFSRIRLRN